MTIGKIFVSQASACEMLGSPFTARILRMMPEILRLKTPVCVRINCWPVDASSAGDNVPLRLMGGLHALARSGRALDLAGAKATKNAPVVWFSMEADGDPKSAALALRLWPGNIAFNLGRADFHGRWVNWREPEF